MGDVSEETREMIRIQRMLGQTGDNWDNYAVARAGLQNELGLYGSTPRPYDISDSTRDVLLAHARQDAAHALLNTMSLLRRVRYLTYVVCVLLAIVAGSVVAIAAALWALLR